MVTTRLFGPLGWLTFALVALVLLVLVPLLNLSVPATSPWHLPSYLVPLLGKYACSRCSSCRSTWSEATPASSRLAMAPSSRSAATRWACI